MIRASVALVVGELVIYFLAALGALILVCLVAIALGTTDVGLRSECIRMDKMTPGCELVLSKVKP